MVSSNEAKTITRIASLAAYLETVDNSFTNR